MRANQQYMKEVARLLKAQVLGRTNKLKTWLGEVQITSAWE